MAVTVQVSRLRTGSPLAGDEPAVVAAGRDDVTDVGVFAGGDPCRNMLGRGDRRSRRAVWMAWLMVSTWSFVDATTATLRPVWW